MTFLFVYKSNKYSYQIRHNRVALINLSHSMSETMSVNGIVASKISIDTQL